ncbi:MULTISPECIES: ferredoxin [Streptomyces]|nr:MULTISPECIES: ferredoxin [Streptomyces]UUS29558.1 ferredoxin [Streptomyces changanensis]
MTWTTEVDQGRCMGSGMCAALAPDLFRLEDTHAAPVHARIPADERALDAADSCPALAIVVRDGPHTIGPRP